MRAMLLTGFAALLLIAVGSLAGSLAVSADANTSPVGLWQATDPDTKQPSGWFLISNHDGVYDGALVKMFLGPGDDPNKVCDECKDDRHDQPWLGLQIIRGMKPESDNKYTGGTILDPRDGNVYSAMMTVSPDGQTLIIRGYLGFSLLGRNEYWTRLPDSDLSQLDPAIKNTLVPAPAPPGKPAVSPQRH